MKKQFENLFEAISKEQARNLASQVRETLATGNYITVNKTFTATDLWSIQRHRKSATLRRHAL